MKRIALIAVLALAGCEEQKPEPNPALDRMQAACDAGKMDACQAVLNYHNQRRQAIATALSGTPLLKPSTPSYTYRLPTN